MSELSHVMVDLETRGTVPGCVAFSIGAVEFFPDRGILGREFYTIISIADCRDFFLTEDHSPNGTVAWWDRQSPEARVALEEALKEDAPKLKDSLENLNGFLRQCGNLRSLRLYGNGADFDNPILRCMYDAADVDFMGSKAGFFGGRCYRSLKNLDELLGPGFKFSKIERTGTYHNALDDAKSQALHLMENLARIREYYNL